MEKRYKSDKLRFKYINKWIKGENILDIGSKEGYLHKLLINANKNKKIYSSDIKNSDFNQDFNKKWKINKKFDTLIAGEIIEHLENPVNFIEECKKILKKSSRLILTTPNAIGLQYIRNPSWCVKGERSHNITFTLPMLEKLLKQQGFEVIHKDYINAFWINNPLQIIPLLFKKLKTDIIIVAKNKF